MHIVRVGDLPSLTNKEREVLDMLTNADSKQAIARKLGIKPRTVERHIDDVANKFFNNESAFKKVKEAEDSTENKLEDVNVDGGYIERITLILKIYREHYLEDKSDLRSTNYIHRHNVRFEMELTEDETIIEAEYSIQSLYDKLPFVSHGLSLDDRSPKADASHRLLEASTTSEKRIVKAETVLDDPKRPSFRVYFDPPLEVGERITYRYRIKSANYFPMSQEEIMRRIESGWYHLSEVEAESNYTISTPTDHLYWQLTFPPKFEIENEHVLVEVKPGAPPDLEEEKRMQNASAFKKVVLRFFSFGDVTRLILDLDKPKINHRYRIRWRPRN